MNMSVFKIGIITYASKIFSNILYIVGEICVKNYKSAIWQIGSK
jgi:hypothetical protein